MAASSTAAGAEPGHGQRQDRDDRTRHAGIVAGLGRHQPLDRALAELLALAAGPLGGGVGGPGCDVLAHARHDADEGADHPRADDGAPVAQHVANSGDDGVEAVDGEGLRPLAHGAQHLGEAEGADECGDQAEAAHELRDAVGETRVGVDALLPHHREQQAEEAGEPALERVAAGEIAGDDHAEDGEPEELVGAEARGRPRPGRVSGVPGTACRSRCR